MIRSFLTFTACMLLAGQTLAGGLIATVPYDSDSQVLRFQLTDQDTPDTCPSTDLTHDTASLVINISSNVTNGFYDTYTVTGTDDLEAITTVGTYEAPSDLTAPGTARFGVVAAGSCWYELHLPNAAFSITGGSGGTVEADRLYIEISDNAGEIMDDAFWVDLTGVAADTLVDNIWGESTSGYNTSATFGKNLGADVPAILVDTDSSIPTLIDALPTATENRDAILNAVVASLEAENISVACGLAATFATLFGEMTVAGGGPTITFKDPDGATTIAEIVMTGTDRTSATITCP